MVGLIDRLRTNQRALALGSFYEVPKANVIDGKLERNRHNKYKLDNFWKVNFTSETL